MTGKLIEAMRDQADQFGASGLDLDAIVHEGDRRTRRRRLSMAAFGVVGAVAVGGAAFQVFQPAPSETHATDGTTQHPHALSYATGSQIHAGGQDIDAGRRLRAYVETDAGFVFTSTDSGVYTLVDGEVTRVGTLGETVPDQPELVADGGRVAWVDAEDGFTVRDVVSGQVAHTPATGSAQTGKVVPAVTALDGTTAYMSDVLGPLVWDTVTGEITMGGPLDSARVVDAEGGVRLVEDGQSDAVVSPAGSVSVQIDDFANLSPDGRYVTTSYQDEGFLIDARTGDKLPFQHGYDWAIGYQWLDDGTFAAMVLNQVGEDWGQPSLLTCAAATGACETTVKDLPGQMGEFQLPIGIAFVEDS